MNIIIRNEEEKDYKIVEEVTREAFYNLYVPGCNEHLIVNKMRKHKDFLPKLSFVIEVDGTVIGSIFYTKSSILLKDGSTVDTITFGPVSILPKFQKQGFGKKIIEHSINVAKEEDNCFGES